MAATKITIRNNGSVKVEGDFEVVDQEGKAFGSWADERLWPSAAADIRSPSRSATGLTRTPTSRARYRPSISPRPSPSPKPQNRVRIALVSYVLTGRKGANSRRFRPSPLSPFPHILLFKHRLPSTKTTLDKGIPVAILKLGCSSGG